MVRRTPLLRLLLLLSGVLLIAGGLAVAPSTAGPAAPADRVVADKSGHRAQAALERVERIFSGTRTASTAPRRVDATLALRDLYMLKDQLQGADRETANRLLGRPSQPDCVQFDYACYGAATVHTACSSVVCVHYVLSGPHAIKAADTSPANGTPDYADKALAAMTNVHNTYTNAGYRSPLPDGLLGGDSKPDAYLAQIGDQGLYGYCTSDDSNLDNDYDAWAYCVLDNDYRKAEFPTNSPIKNLQVTAAHEYFHAVQYAYDWHEDGWFLEATATWAEDVVYDSVNDNLNYLPSGQMRKTAIPLDKFTGLFHYGNWIWFRYLTDRYGSGNGLEMILDMLQRVDGATGGPDQYSLQAVANVLEDRGTTLRHEYAAFASGNRLPQATYEDEGVEASYPTAPLNGTKTLTRADPRNRRAFELDHLTSRTYRFVPGTGLTTNDSRLEVQLNLNPAAQGGAAYVTVKPSSGPAVQAPVTLDAQGDGSFTEAFQKGSVSWIEVTVVNASDRFDCWQGTRFSCRGDALDDNRQQVVVAKALR